MPPKTLTCGFCGSTGLALPSSPFWALNCPNCQAYYFEADDELHSSIAALLGDETNSRKVDECIDVFRERGDLLKVGGWQFLRLPQMPKLTLPSPAELILARANKMDLLPGVRNQIETYCSQIEKLLREQ